MQYTVTFRHMEPSETLKEYSYDKLLKLEKYLDAVIDAEVIMTVEKIRHKAEVIITSDGLKIVAEEETGDMYSAIDMVVDKLEKQIKRHREKLKDHKSVANKRSPQRLTESEGFSGNDDLDDDPDLPLIDRETTVTPEKMTVEEAGAQLASGTASQVFFINTQNGLVSVLRQVHGGQIELITIK